MHLVQAEFFSEPGNLCVDPDVQEAYASTEMAARVTAVVAAHQLATQSPPQSQHWFGSSAAADTTDAGVPTDVFNCIRRDQTAFLVCNGSPEQENKLSETLCSACVPCFLNTRQAHYRMVLWLPEANIRYFI